MVLKRVRFADLEPSPPAPTMAQGEVMIANPKGNGMAAPAPTHTKRRGPRKVASAEKDSTASSLPTTTTMAPGEVNISTSDDVGDGRVPPTTTERPAKKAKIGLPDGEATSPSLNTTVKGRGSKANDADSDEAVGPTTAKKSRTKRARVWDEVASYFGIDTTATADAEDDEPSNSLEELDKTVHSWLKPVPAGEKGEMRMNRIPTDVATTLFSHHVSNENKKLYYTDLAELPVKPMDINSLLYNPLPLPVTEDETDVFMDDVMDEATNTTDRLADHLDQPVIPFNPVESSAGPSTTRPARSTAVASSHANATAAFADGMGTIFSPSVPARRPDNLTRPEDSMGTIFSSSVKLPTPRSENLTRQEGEAVSDRIDTDTAPRAVNSPKIHGRKRKGGSTEGKTGKDTKHASGRPIPDPRALLAMLKPSKVNPEPISEVRKEYAESLDRRPPGGVPVIRKNVSKDGLYRPDQQGDKDTRRVPTTSVAEEGLYTLGRRGDEETGGRKGKTVRKANKRKADQL